MRVYTENAFPIDWARTQNNLGAAYGDRISGEKRDNIEKAIDYYRKALTIYKPESDPIECLRTCRNLGNLALGEENWQLAVEAYSQGIVAVEQSREWASNSNSKQEIIANAIDVYQNIVRAYIELEQMDKALEYVERGKTRNLVELLANRDLYPKGDIPPDINTRLDSLRREIIAEENQLRQRERIAGIDLNSSQASDDRGLKINYPASQIPDRTRLNDLRQQLERLIVEEIQDIDPAFPLSQRVEPIIFAEIQATLPDSCTVLLEWYVREDSLAVFLVAANGETPHLIAYTEEQFQGLSATASRYLDTYLQRDGQWQENLPSLFAELAEYLQLATIVDQIKAIIPDCHRLILVPHRWLHLLPIHALPLDDDRYLLDLFSQGVSYAPSVQLLKLTQKQTKPNTRNFFAIQNPTQDLNFTDLEVKIIQTWFQPDDRVFPADRADKTTLDRDILGRANYSHFSCHGYFNFDNPELSALLLAGSLTDVNPATATNKSRYLPTRDGGSIDIEKCLTLGEIFALDLRQCCLVVLSACETGLSDFRSLSDEYIGLPSGFLYAGSPNVVSSLWAVNDLSTAFLTIKFYENLWQNSQENDSVTIALNQAQIWLRNVTKAELQTWIAPLLTQENRNLKFQVDRALLGFESFDKPFASPYYWAAFCAVGR